MPNWLCPSCGTSTYGKTQHRCIDDCGQPFMAYDRDPVPTKTRRRLDRATATTTARIQDRAMPVLGEPPPKPDTLAEAAEVFKLILLRETKQGRARAHALARLEECLMWAEKSRRG